jgi:hypothetical protein
MRKRLITGITFLPEEGFLWKRSLKNYMKSRAFIAGLFFALLFACSSNPSYLEQALTLAGDNRGELESVLDHYRDDPQKQAAARFLIANMPGKYAEDNRPYEDFRAMFDEWKQLKLKMGYIPPETSDSLTRAYLLASGRERLFDLQHIKASYLIGNIDRSFEVWMSMPWGRDIPFEVFCEEILPYRIEMEALENWRDLVLEQYRPLYDSLRNSHADVFTACIRIFEAMGLEWDSINKASALLPTTGYLMLNHLRTGPCTERVKYGIYVMRAFGIPVSRDYTPQWPFRSMGHDWASLRWQMGNTFRLFRRNLSPASRISRIIAWPRHSGICIPSSHRRLPAFPGQLTFQACSAMYVCTTCPP